MKSFKKYKPNIGPEISKMKKSEKEMSHGVKKLFRK